MKKTTILLLLCMGLGIVLAGCSGTIDSGSDRCRRYWQITELQARQFNDDLDYLLLYEQSSRLTEYHARVGR